MLIMSIDPGISGAISVFTAGVLTSVVDMPLIKLTTREPRTKFKHKDPKIVFKSGLAKGKRQRIQTHAGKYKHVLDFTKLVEGIKWVSPDVIVLETQFALTNRAKTIYQNYGALLGISYALVGCNNTVEVPPVTWKNSLQLTNLDKVASIPLAEKLYPSFKFKSHDQADSVLIGYYYLKQQEQL